MTESTKHGVMNENGTWVAYVMGATVAAGPDRSLIEAAFEHHVEPLRRMSDDRFEYATTTNERKGYPNPPSGDGWVEVAWERFDYHEEAVWARPKT